MSWFDSQPTLRGFLRNTSMRAGTTREFWALCSIAAHFGRPGTPTDQAWIETLFGHVKTEWPHLEKIRDPNTLRAELDIVRDDYNTRRLHASLGYVTPDDEHTGRGDTIRQARRDGLARARLTRNTPTIATTTKTSHEHTRPMRRNQTPKNGHLLRSTSLDSQPSSTAPPSTTTSRPKSTPSSPTPGTTPPRPRLATRSP